MVDDAGCRTTQARSKPFHFPAPKVPNRPPQRSLMAALRSNFHLLHDTLCFLLMRPYAQDVLYSTISSANDCLRYHELIYVYMTFCTSSNRLQHHTVLRQAASMENSRSSFDSYENVDERFDRVLSSDSGIEYLSRSLHSSTDCGHSPIRGKILHHSENRTLEDQRLAPIPLLWSARSSIMAQ